MNTATISNPAANSTPPAEPAESPSAPDNEGANIGDVTAADVARELGLLPEGQETESDDGEESAPAPEVEKPETETETDTDEDSGESAEPAAPSEAEGESGEPPIEETETPPEAKAPEETSGKKEAFNQRIDQLTKARREAETEAATWREKAKSYEARDEGNLEPSALANVDTPQELADTRARYIKLHKWTLEHPDGGTMADSKGVETEFSREDVARFQSKTFELLNETLPLRQQFLERRAAADAEAVRSYPWMTERTKGDGLALQRAIEALPVLRLVPEGRIIAANALVGNKLRMAGIVVTDAMIKRLADEQNAKKGNRPAAPARAPSAPARMGSMPARRAPAAAQERAMQKALSHSSGSAADLAQSIAAKMR